MNKIIAITLIILVGALNVCLNICVKYAAASPKPYIEVVQSPRFFLAFGVGCLSILGLLGVYSTGTELPRGILLMGAISIIGGSLVGEYLKPKTLRPTEWIILSLLFFLFFYRTFLKE